MDVETVLPTSEGGVVMGLKWTEAKPDFDDCGIMIVETVSGEERYVAKIDYYGDLVDILHGDDFGWGARDVDRWISWDDFIGQIEGVS